MLLYFKRVLLRLYIYFSGASFYLSDLTSDKVKVKELIVKYVNGYEIKFYFHTENVTYYKFFMGYISNERKCIYVVSAVYNEQVPNHVKKFKNLRLYAKSKLFRFLNDEQLLYEALVNVYLDCLAHELQSID